MPSRIIKESICTSDSIDQLSAFQETMFYRLLVNCDDYGRMDARPKILSSKLFPLKDIRANQIEDALRALTSAELVILYTVDGKPFLQMKTWDRHQQIRAKKSKYPGPECGEIASDIICNQLISDDSKCSRNPIQSESESNPKPKRARAEDFDTFWAAYPKKVDKKKAQAAFEKINPDGELLNTMLSSLAAWKKSAQWTKDGGQFIPNPTTWLNGRRWEDEVPKGGTGKQVSAQMYTQREYTADDWAEIQRSYDDDLIREARELYGGK